MDLEKELADYKELISQRDGLNNELVRLSGKNDQDSINRINTLAGQLNNINTNLANYDMENLEKVDRYFTSDKEFRRISDEIKTIEKLSKGTEEEKVEVKSAEGRPKKVYKSLEEEYKALVELKNNMRESFRKQYNEIKNITSIVKTPNVEETITTAQSMEPESSVAKGLENMTNEEKITYYEERIQNILASGKLPNMGKKSQVTYEGVRYNIPKAYIGRFNDAVGKLNALRKKMANNLTENTPKEPEKAETITKPLTPKEAFETKLNEIYTEPTKTAPVKPSKNTLPLEEENPYIFGHYDPRPKPITLPDLINMCEKNKIKLHPIPVTFRKKHKINMKKALTCVKKKMSLENFKKLLPKVWNIDKQVELAFANMNSKLLDKRIVIKEGTVKFARGVIQKYNTAKTHVTNIPKRTKEYIKDKYKDFKNYFREKKEISRLKKEENRSTKEAMELVYGEKKDKHIDYRVVNRTAKFKENTCQRINTAKGKILGTTKAVVGAIKKPFDYLRENMKNDTKRQELQAKIDEARTANRQKAAALKRIKVNPSTGGYAGTIAITVVGVLILATIIFIGIGSIINR